MGVSVLLFLDIIQHIGRYKTITHIQFYLIKKKYKKYLLDLGVLAGTMVRKPDDNIVVKLYSGEKIISLCDAVIFILGSFFIGPRD